MAMMEHAEMEINGIGEISVIILRVVSEGALRGFVAAFLKRSCV